MHQVYVDEWAPLGEETFKKLRLNLPPGGWFPALQHLLWCIAESNLPYANLFFSPHLKTISLLAAQSWDDTGVPPSILPTLASTISALPTSSLERISVRFDHPTDVLGTSSLERISIGADYQTMPWAYFKDSFSSIVLHCGPSFTEYDTPTPLSNAALEHLTKLPHFRTWRIHGAPPKYHTSSFPLVFPPLRELTFGEHAVRGWFPLLRRLEGGASTTQSVTPFSRTKESLKVLNIDDISFIKIEASSVSTIQYFRNLVNLNVEVYCHDGDDRGDCIFELNDHEVTELTMALTQLESLLLGHACFEDTCLTTVACLLSISVHCNRLTKLEIHFDTTNIVDDLKNILEDPRFQQLRSLPRCPLRRLDVYQMPLDLDDSDFGTVANGMIDIFPSLKSCEGLEESWTKLSGEIAKLRGDSG